MSELVQKVYFRPSYDYRDIENDQRGAHGLEIFFALRGPLGVINFQVMTGWMERPIADPNYNFMTTPKPPLRHDRVGCDRGVSDIGPNGMISIHRVTSEGDEEAQPCDLFDNQKWCVTTFCSSLVDDEVLKVMVRSGDKCWSLMEDIYNKEFTSDFDG